MTDVFDRIRLACRRVADRSEHVRIDHDRLVEAAERLGEAPEGAAVDPGRARPGGDEETAAFVIGLDAVNFGSGWFPTLTKRPGMSGYHTVAAGWSEAAPHEAAWMRTIDAAGCAEIFGQDLGQAGPGELMRHFSAALNDLGELVERRYDGSFLTLVAAADASAARLVGLLDEMPYYRDVFAHGGIQVPLYKRAQITAYDLAVAFGHTGPGRFDDLERLTMFADNLVPHVLRLEGVLAFDAALVSRIEAGVEIASGSPEEVEIRAVAVQAVELLVDEIRRRGSADLCAAELDGRLWARGGRPEYKAVPRHRTRCVYY